MDIHCVYACIYVHGEEQYTAERIPEGAAYRVRSFYI